MNIPTELKYSTTHEWLLIEDDVATIGITDHAQSELGDIVFVELPEAGAKLKLDESFGTIESVKTVSDLYAPVAGVVLEVNEELSKKAEIVNKDPYGLGWLIKIKIEDKAALSDLLDADEYAQTIEEN